MCNVLYGGGGGLSKIRAGSLFMKLILHPTFLMVYGNLQWSDRSGIASLFIGLFLCRPYIEGGDSAIMEQMLDMLKVLLDPDSSREAVESDKFLELFYNEYLPELLSRVENCDVR
jgi:hypothetical protein